MTSMPKVETAAMATGVVSMADQIMQAVRDNREHHPENAQAHYIKAAIAGAIAIGAFEMLRRDEDLEHHNHHKHHKHRNHGDHARRDGDVHAKTVGDEVVIYKDDPLRRTTGGGHDEHPGPGRTRDLVAEGLGAAAFAKEADQDLLHHEGK